MTPPRTAAALIIGNELLTGKIAEGNLALLARTLHALGTRLDRVVMVPDERATIAEEVRLLASSRDVLFTSGGVGPTHDDVTIQAVADAFGVPATVSPELRGLIEGHFGDQCTEGHLRMARVPEGARLIGGERVPWPAVVMRNVWILPGVPQIFAMKMRLVRAEFGVGVPFVSLAVLTSLDECSLKPLLDCIVAEHPDVDVGSYPKWRRPGYRTEVTFDGRDKQAVTTARDAFRRLVPAEALVADE